MDMMCTFYIDHHINIDPNASILFVMMNARKFSFSLGLPLGCMLIENGFGYRNNGALKIFDCERCGDRKNYVTKHVMTKTF
jgi:hypothetical protein